MVGPDQAESVTVQSMFKLVTVGNCNVLTLKIYKDKARVPEL